MSPDAWSKDALVIGWSARGKKAARASHGEETKGQGSGGLFRVTVLGTRYSSPISLFLARERKCSFSGLGPWKSGRLRGVVEVASCLCWGSLQVLMLDVAEPRHVAFLAEVSGFVSGVKAPHLPTLGWLPRSLMCRQGEGGGQLVQASTVRRPRNNKVVCGEARPPLGALSGALGAAPRRFVFI